MNLDGEFLKQLRATFKGEAEEHLQIITTDLLALEVDPGGAGARDRISRIFRAAHSLKGAARATNVFAVESICQPLEGIFSAWMNSDLTPASTDFNLLHRALNLMTSLVQNCSTEDGPADDLGVPAIVQQLEAVLPKGSASSAAPEMVPPPPVVPPTPPSPAPSKAKTEEKADLPNSIRISTAKLEKVLLNSEELIEVKLTAAKRTQEFRRLKEDFAAWNGEWHRVQSQLKQVQSSSTTANKEETNGSAAARELLPGKIMSDFLAWNSAFIRSLEDRVHRLAKSGAEEEHATVRRVDDLVHNSKNLLMLPFSSLSDILPKMARDLSKAQKKDVELVVRGAGIEMDKRILEQLKDPLVHLVRNSIDHGVELPEIRRQNSKPPRASISVTVSQMPANKIEITVSDDGAGIDLEKVKQSARTRGRFAPEAGAAISDEEALQLIFEPEFSTTSSVTDISGRGLGLAIVREKTERLGGTVSVENSPARGAAFRLVLPQVLAAFRGILVRSAGEIFALPIPGVEKVLRVKASDIRVIDHHETIVFNKVVIPLARLNDLLNLQQREGKEQKERSNPVVVVSLGAERMAVLVDEVLHEEEVLVKDFPRPILKVPNLSGLAFLASGRIAPVLNTVDLLKNRNGKPASRLLSPPAPPKLKPSKITSKRILIAEDSITSRMLLKNILESAGYHVEVAVDGVAALTELRTADFDLLLSDVEMPRMNGFELTAHVRRDDKLSKLPVVLVTALSSQEDRERGIDVGANAYIVKSKFNQSNLLEAIKRVI